MVDPQGHRGAGLDWKVGIPSQIQVAKMNSLEGVESSKLGIGGAFSQLLVSLLLTSVNILALP